MRQLLSGRGRRGGFTLIDVLVAAVLLAVAILFVSTIFPMGYSSVDAGGELTEAAVLAEHMLEKIKSARWRVATVLVSVQFSHGIRGTKTVTVGTRISE